MGIVKGFCEVNMVIIIGKCYNNFVLRIRQSERTKNEQTKINKNRAQLGFV